MTFGEQQSGNGNFSTTVVRNMCQFADCDPTAVAELAQNENICLMPYQPVDVVIKDKSELKLVTRTMGTCRTINGIPNEDGGTTSQRVGCDGNLYVNTPTARNP